MAQNENMAGDIKELCKEISDALQTEVHCLQTEDPRNGKYGWLVYWDTDKGEKAFLIDREIWNVNRSKEIANRIEYKRIHRKLQKENKFVVEANDPKTRQLGMVVPGANGGMLYTHKIGHRQEPKEMIRSIKRRLKNGAKLSFDFNKKDENESNS